MYRSFKADGSYATQPVLKAAVKRPQTFGFLLTPGFTLLGLSNAVETLREANRILGWQAYRWHTLSTDGGSVRASSGVCVGVQFAVITAPRCDAAFVCADWDLENAATSEVCRWLQALDRRDCMLGAISAGTYVLARADVINGRRCTIHWESAPSIADRFPHVRPSRRVYEADQRLYTCAGGMGVFDLFVRLVSAEHGKDVGEQLKVALQLDRIRSSEEEQRMTPLAELSARPRKLQGAIREMQASLEMPVSPEAIAAKVGVTTRHLQRLFRTHTGASPAKFYMDLRLRQAQLLLQQTRMTVLEVAVAVGFTSHSHFSKRYRERYNRTPQQERALERRTTAVMTGFEAPHDALWERAKPSWV